MAHVTVTVNAQSYTLACDDGEESHLTDLARQIDKRVADVKRDVGAAREAEMFLMTALLLEDELALANERIQELEEELAGIKDDPTAPPKPARKAVDEEKFAGLLESAARRMEDIAARLG